SAQLRGNHTCKFQGQQSIQFGVYVDGQEAPRHTVTAFQVRCKGTAILFDIPLTAGPGENSGDMLDRRLRHRDGDELRYQLYVDSARTRVWGDGTRGTEAIVLTARTATKVGTAYGEIPGGQGGPEGDYDDTIVITVLP
ncbi:MAG TPA: spore coat U domain-containing protein, partial [Usitatibacter sp.]|nr:spore coat U domain-containing protein [Usitatibacter sp.]